MEGYEPDISSLPREMKIELLLWLGDPCNIGNYAELNAGMRDVVNSQDTLDRLSSTYMLPRSDSLQSLCDICRSSTTVDKTLLILRLIDDKRADLIDYWLPIVVLSYAWNVVEEAAEEVVDNDIRITQVEYLVDMCERAIEGGDINIISHVMSHCLSLIYNTSAANVNSLISSSTSSCNGILVTSIVELIYTIIPGLDSNLVARAIARSLIDNRCQAELMEELLSRYPLANADVQPTFHHAAWYNRKDILLLILSTYNLDINAEALLAVVNRNAPTLKLMIELGESNYSELMDAATEYSNTEYDDDTATIIGYITSASSIRSVY